MLAAPRKRYNCDAAVGIPRRAPTGATRRRFQVRDSGFTSVIVENMAPMKRLPSVLAAILLLLSACGDGGGAPSVVEGFDVGEVARTPDERFAGLVDYPFAAHYQQAGPVRIHYIDEGPRDADPVVLLHGEPSWSYLYRHMIPIIVDAGYRVIAPDLVGFGKSDKPVDREQYSYQRHVDWMRFLLEEELDLDNVTMFLQDWGGLIGLRLVAEDPDRYARVVVANTFLPTGDIPPSAAFKAFRDFVATSPVLPIGVLLQGASARTLSADEVAAYDAPFPSERFLGGARKFPELVPTDPDDPAVPANLAAWKVLEMFTKPFVTMFSDGDPITRGADILFQARVPGTEGQPNRTVSGGHFLQEDSPVELAEAIVDFIESTPN